MYQEGATLLHQASEGSLSVPGQPLLYLTGTTSVFLGTDPEVLTWREETQGMDQDRDTEAAVEAEEFAART